MIKLVKTIVNENRKLVGFMVEGPDSMLGGFSNYSVLKPVPLNVLVNSNFKNKQVIITKNGIKELGNFKVHDLPMVVNIENKFVDIDNSIAVVKKFVKEDEIIGFRLRFADGHEDNYEYINVIKLAFWFNPENFMVRTSAKNKKFVSGKPGVLKLEDLPTEYVGQKKEDNLKSKNKAKEDINMVGAFSNVLDIMDLMDALRACDGIIIKMPDEKYIKTGEGVVRTAKTFIPLGVGEFASPFLSFNESKLNVNAAFKKPGSVVVEFGPGVSTTITAFTYNTKNIFYNAENYIKRLGVAIPKAYEQEFNDKIGKTLSIQPIVNTELVQAVCAITGKKDLVFFELDTNKLSLINDSKLESYILSAREINDLMVDYVTPKLISKYLAQATGLIKEIKSQIGSDIRAAGGKLPAVLYRGMNNEYIEKIKEAGIDIYTGSFNVTESYVKDEKDESEEKEKQEKQVIVEIEYSLKGIDFKKLTFNKIRELGIAGDNLPSQVIEVVRKLENIKDPLEKLEIARKILEKTEEKVNNIVRMLWLHKCSMYLKGNKTKIHQHDINSWTLDIKSRKKANVYNCTEPGCENLSVAIVNSDI